MSEAKPFCISKWEVWKAYKRVKANQGAAGVDEQSIADFEKKLKGNLYKIWNRMSSGSYFPPPRSGCFKGARTDREENIVESTDDPTSVRTPPRPSSPPRQGRCEALGARSPRSPSCFSLELLEEERNHATCTQQRDTKPLPAAPDVFSRA